MNRFNNLYSTVQMNRSISPFATAGSSALNTFSRSNGLLSRLGSTSKFNLSSFLTGAQKTIGTVNQIVPLYNQVKPLFQNSKVLLNVVNSFKKDNNSKGLFSLKRNKNQPIYQNNVTPTDNKKEEKHSSFKDENSPSKPFFA